MTETVANKIRKLAKKHKVTEERDAVSRMAVNITRLAGDMIELDGTERLLVNLKKKGVLSKAETLALQGQHLQEKRRSKKKLTA